MYTVVSVKRLLTTMKSKSHRSRSACGLHRPFRSLLKSLACIIGCLTLLVVSHHRVSAQQPGQALPPWSKGMLDIHHINTGHGVSAFMVLPDATTLHVDAGELDPTDSRTQGPRNSKMHPNDRRPAYEWIVNYIRQFHPAGTKGVLDYALISHFHDDHFGSLHQKSPMSASGRYRLTGITGVGELIPIGTLIDRGYVYPFNMKSDSVRNAMINHQGGGADAYRTMENYWAFEEAQAKKGMKVEMLQAGKSSQIQLKHQREAYAQFRIVNIKSNGSIWTGEGTETFEYFPKGYMASENPLSLAIRIDYGSFRYYTGGDNPGVVDLGASKYNDTETPMAGVVGDVDVAVMNHHGNRDSQNEVFVKTLKPRIWIEQVWSSDHPGHEVLRRVTSKYLYAGDRDLFATNMLEANKNVIGSLIDQSYKSMDGHIVVRVDPGGLQYHVIILNDDNEQREVKAVFGPYAARTKQ
jgi:beta-lactamase superfamily II metal-dependent hydrolase